MAMSTLQAARQSLKKNKNVDVENNRVLLDPNNMVTHPHLSTGSVVLDFMIGGNKLPTGERQCPGLPRGRITELYGAEGSGKCVTADTFVMSESGMITIAELFESTGNPVAVTDKIKPISVQLLNEKNEWELTSHFTWNGRKKVYHIENSLGMGISITANHPVRVMGEDGAIQWKYGKDIIEGDQMIVQVGTNKFPSLSSLSEDEATWLGYITADGSLGSEHRIAFSNSVPEIVDNFYALTNRIFPDAAPLSYAKADSKTIDHHINSVQIRKEVESRYALGYGKADSKSVPRKVREGTREVQASFLRAYIDLECSIDSERRTMEITSKSRDLLRQTQMMLLNFGILSGISLKRVDDENYWRMSVTGENTQRYVEEIGFISHQRNESVSNFPDVSYNTNVDVIPNISMMLGSLFKSLGDTRRADAFIKNDYASGKSNPSRTKLREILNLSKGRGDIYATFAHAYLSEILDRGYAFSPVTNITTEEDVPTFDVCLPKTHSFWSNGFISHNTTVALEAAVQCQQAGGSVCFLDYENAISPAYAKALGIDFSEDKWDLYCPTTWEEGAEIIKTMINAKVDMIIVDSISAMVPKATFEKDPSDIAQIGLLARLMSGFLPNIVGDLRRSGTALVYINQLRSRIKTSKYDAGPDEDTSGGKAVKYYVSLRIKLKKLKTEYTNMSNDLTGDSEKQPICNIVRAQCTKNKVSSHQGFTSDFVLRYGHGIDNPRSIIDIAETRRIIKRSGAWYTFIDASGEEQRVQGKEALRSFLMENATHFHFLADKILSSIDDVLAKSEMVADAATPENANAVVEVESHLDPEIEALLEEFIKEGRIKTAGPWLKFEDEEGEKQSHKGRSATVEYLMDHPETMAFLAQ